MIWLFSGSFGAIPPLMRSGGMEALFIHDLAL